MSFIPIDDLEVYKVAMEIGEEVWVVVDKWNDFQKEAIGGSFAKQQIPLQPISPKDMDAFTTKKIEISAFMHVAHC